MVVVPPEYVINSTLQVGTIYKFEAPELISTDIPHYFIIVGIEDEDNYLALCTTQLEKKIKHFENYSLDFSGLVYIKPDEQNGLSDDTYVNCHDYYTISKSDLINKCSTSTLSYTGEVSLDHYTQIKTGIIDSHTNDLPEYLLSHPSDEVTTTP
ncbi:hypothetical protein [Plebeiibacterium sediminum]|uniref:Uncharacterized protein n=1 Tax=Plebeiibacterium sediminum TaxID=2992112 RepID=A0AAE3SDK2_9BACT|nr:hypothetical protein [Plebeiobacterium sediminum]MCW3785503.1 hypothetical protein [Plebeiobacterium sediminum]